MVKKRLGLRKGFLNLIDKSPFICKVLLFLGIRDTREKKRELRTIYVNNQRPDNYIGKDEPFNYTSNSIRTSRYRWWNFVPKNLYHQFKRLANLYFLINAIAMFVIPNPSVNPFLSAIPLFMVVLITAIKQGYEDILRHIHDWKINQTGVRILRDGQFKDFKWKDIKCGDIVEVLPDQQFPCDMVLLYSQTEQQICHITTANLDGETNLKIRSVPPRIPSHSTVKELSEYRAVIQCEIPNIKLNEFRGKMIVNNIEYPITNENLLLRGACLKLSPRIYGCAVYTGKDTKMMKNSKFKSNKSSCIQTRMNFFIAIYLIVLAFLTFFSFAASVIYYTSIYFSHWYLYGRELEYFYSNRNYYNFLLVVQYVVLYNDIVPIFLNLTIEFQRFFGSRWIGHDLEMYDEKLDEPAKANTSDLNEDLGQIEYLFSDKTGTLTENEMELKQFSVDGVIYYEKDNQLYTLADDQPVDLNENKKVRLTLVVLCLCHTVQIDENTNGNYQASSPDELSFVKFCQKIGVVYEGETKESVTSSVIRRVRIKDKINRYKVLHILEFDSNRKRMSIILEDLQTKKKMLLCKGAETGIFTQTSDEDVSVINEDLKKFANQGWRTLVLATRKISDELYIQIEEMLTTAYNDIVNRERKVQEAYKFIESNLKLVGATAVEDKLQEGVAETLFSLRKAGIKIWVLTGDKKETAINISNSCKHISTFMEKLYLTDLDSMNEIQIKMEQYRTKMRTQRNQSFALIVDSMTLTVIFEGGDSSRNDFCNLCLRCDAVLCCRMSPAQKAQIVKLVKHSRGKPVTAAIGDGANDVSMIQQAHVGLGIYGKEGRNAARSADFCFAKFKHVRRIFLVHGYLYYSRSAVLVQFSFYKSIPFVLGYFYYSFSSAFTTTELFDAIVQIFYNAFLTSVPILVFGLFEQRTSIDVLECNEFYYRTIRRNNLLKFKEYVKWNLLGIWHASVCYFFPFIVFNFGTPFSEDGKMNGGQELGALVFTLIFLTIHAKLLIEWHYITYALLVSYAISLAIFLVCLILPNSFVVPSPVTYLTDDQSMFWLYFDFLSKPSMWLLMILTVITCILPDLVLKVFENIYYDRMIRELRKSVR